MAALAFLWLLSAAPVAADCDMPGPIEEELARAPIAFVGTVVDVEGSRATFEVGEVWAGEIPPVVEVYGLFGPGGEKGDRLPGVVVLPTSNAREDFGDSRVPAI